MGAIGEPGSSTPEIDGEKTRDEGGAIPGLQSTPFFAFLIAALALLMLASGIFGGGGIGVVLLSLPFLLLAVLMIRGARFMGADIVINQVGVFRKRGKITYQAIQWADVSAIELSRGGGMRGSPTYSVYRLVLKPTSGGKKRRGLGVGRPQLSNPGRLIRLFNNYASRNDIPIFLDEGFTKRKLDQLPYEEMDWDPVSMALSRRKDSG